MNKGDRRLIRTQVQQALQIRLSPVSQFLWSLSCLLVAGLLLWGSIVAPVAAETYDSTSLIGADFSDQVLVDASFTRTNLRGSNFSHSDLQGVSLFGANLESASLEGANLSNATLDNARLSRANLSNAILAGAFVFNAKFDGATIEGADFTDVFLRQDVQDQLCQVAKGVNPVTGRETRETLDCDY